MKSIQPRVYPPITPHRSVKMYAYQWERNYGPVDGVPCICDLTDATTSSALDCFVGECFACTPGGSCERACWDAWYDFMEAMDA